MKIKVAGQQQDTDRMARKPTDLPSLAAAMVEDATKAFVRDDGAMASEAVLRHYRAATRAAVAAALRRLARHSAGIFDDGRIHIEQLIVEIEGPSDRATQSAEPCAGNAKEAHDS